MHLSRRNIISIDVESNGLYGQPFCVGAIEMDWGGRVIDEYVGRCPLAEVEDDWGKENVSPQITDIEEKYQSLEELGGIFRGWLARAVESSWRKGVKPIILVDVGFPVDQSFLYGVFRSIRHKSPNIVKELSPYPLYDLASILAGAGLDPDLSRADFSRDLKPSRTATHHPLTDAELIALCLVLTIRILEERHDKGIHSCR